MASDAPVETDDAKIEERREGKAPGKAPTSDSEPLDFLKARIAQITRSINAQWGIYMQCIETDEEIALDADVVMDTMSVIKIPLMVEVLRQAEAGNFLLSDRLIVQKSDKRPGTGIIRYLDDGAALTINDLITLMINVSDNSATDMLFAQVGGIEPVNALMQRYGWTTIRATGTTEEWFQALRAEPDSWTFHRDGKHPFGLSSARDTGRLLAGIVKGEVVSKSASAQMMAALRSQLYRSRLPRYLYRQRCRDPRTSEPHGDPLRLYRASQRQRRDAGGRHRTDRGAGQQLFLLSVSGR
jgi:beta-lactamase class A